MTDATRTKQHRLRAAGQAPSRPGEHPESARRRPHSARIWAGAFACAIACSWGGRIEATEQPPTGPAAAEPRPNGQQAADLRAEMEVLLRSIQDPEAREQIEAALGTDGSRGRMRAVAEAAAAMEAPPVDLIPILARSLAGLDTSEASDETRRGDIRSLLAALGRYSTREAVTPVIELALRTSPPVQQQVRRAAFDALIRQTGLVSNGSDADRWRAWWAEARWIPEQEWWRAIAQAQSARAMALEGSRRAAEQEIVSLYRRLHAQSDDDARPGIMIEMLSSSEPAARRAAFELIMVALLNAKSIPDSVAAKSAELLADRDPAIRADAARALERLARPGFADDIEAALGIESDPAAAGWLLRAASKSSAVVAPATIVRWLGSGGPAREAASEYLVAALRSGRIDAAQTDHIRPALADIDSATMAPSTMELLVLLGESRRLAPLLLSSDQAMARAAAAALADDPSHLDAIIEAARQRPDLFDSAAQALTGHKPDAEGFEILSALPCESPERRAAALRTLAGALSPGELLRIARRTDNLSDRAKYLSAAIDDEFLSRLQDTPDRVEAAILLARTLLELRRPADVLALLDRLPPEWSGQRMIGLRITALLNLSRFPEADELAAPAATPLLTMIPPAFEADAWLEALAYTDDERAAFTLRRALLARFSGLLTQAQRLRLEQLSARFDGPSAAGPQTQP